MSISESVLSSKVGIQKLKGTQSTFSATRMTGGTPRMTQLGCGLIGHCQPVCMIYVTSPRPPMPVYWHVTGSWSWQFIIHARAYSNS